MRREKESRTDGLSSVASAFNLNNAWRVINRSGCFETIDIVAHIMNLKVSILRDDAILEHVTNEI
jgi:hypothetical protein